MKAMVLETLSSVAEEDNPLVLRELPVPEPGFDEVLIRVSACGVCHTELDEIEGRTPPPELPVILGHQVVGRIVKLGSGVSTHMVGERVGVGWIHRSSGEVDENISDAFVATGRDVHGGYADYMCAPEQYAYPIPEHFSDIQAAPLLCAGAIGYRALKLTGLEDGDPLGLTGFGGSAHLVLQLTRFLYPRSPVYVFAHNEESREFAREMNADWVGDTKERPPIPLAAIIDTTPAWTPVIAALANLKPGGRLVVNAIRKEDHDKEALLNLSYHDHLWMEREIKSVANITAADIREFLAIAADIPIEAEVQIYSLADANRAVVELKRNAVTGAKVLVTDS